MCTFPNLIILGFALILMQWSNWGKISRGAQSNDLKTALQVQNYLTQTRGELRLPPSTKLIF